MTWVLFSTLASNANSLTLSFHKPLDYLQHAFAYGRAVVTPYTFATTFVPTFLSFYAMAVLVQLPGTRLYRVSLLPVVFWMSFRANMLLDFSWNYPGLAFLNQGLALGMFIIAMRSTTWAVAQRPYTRLPICELGNGTVNGPAPIEHDVSVSSAMWNAWDLVVNMRCIGWSGPPRMRMPTPYLQVESRSIFSLLSLCRFIFLLVAFDAMCGYVRSLGPETFGAPTGGTIFDASLALPERYMKSSLVSLLSWIAVYIVIEMVYQLHAALFTILFWQHPSQWPPLFDYPWFATSLASLWGRRWHQLFREYFVAVGSKPAERLLGRVGTVIGAFVVSGVLHDVGVRGMGRGAATLPVVGFFLMHGVGVVMEEVWKQATGRQVGGVVGWLWMTFWLLLWGHFLVDAWARKGLLGSEFLPDAYRPSLLLMNWISR